MIFPESPFLSWFFRGAAFFSSALVLSAHRLVGSALWRPVAWLRDGLRFTPHLATASCILFGTWYRVNPGDNVPSDQGCFGL